MCLKYVAYLIISIHLVQSYTIKKDDEISLRTNRTAVQVNGDRFKELNCLNNEPLCSNSTADHNATRFKTFTQFLPGDEEANQTLFVIKIIIIFVILILMCIFGIPCCAGITVYLLVRECNCLLILNDCLNCYHAILRWLGCWNSLKYR